MNIPRTERRNPSSMNFDMMTTEEMAKLIISANHCAVDAVERACVQIRDAIDAVVAAFEGGFRLIYVGAGTSGSQARN